MKKLLYLAVLTILAAVVTAVSYDLLHNEGSQTKTIFQLPLPEADILITHTTIVTQSEHHEILDNAWIAIKKDTIADIGIGRPRYQSAQTIDGTDSIVLPGLINTHSHVGMSNITTVKPAPLQAWLKSLEPIEAKLTADDVYEASKKGMTELMHNGVTTINDMYFHPESVQKAAIETGMRAVIRLPLIKQDKKIIIDPVFPTTDNPLITYSLAPNPLTNYSLEQLTEIAALAQEKHAVVHIHFESDNTEKKTFKKIFKATPLEVLKKSGLINQQLVLAHSVDLDPEELHELQQYPNVSIAVTPRSEQNLQTGLADVTAALHSTNVTLGTDGTPSSGDLDMFKDLHELLHNYDFDSTTLLDIATAHGAKALGLSSKIGSLEVGKQADLIVLKPSAQHTDAETRIVNSFGRNLTHTIIAGKLIK